MIWKEMLYLGWRCSQASGAVASWCSGEMTRCRQTRSGKEDNRGRQGTLARLRRALLCKKKTNEINWKFRRYHMWRCHLAKAKGNWIKSHTHGLCYHIISQYEPSQGFINHDMDTLQADMWKINSTKYIYKQVNRGYFWLSCFIVLLTNLLDQLLLAQVLTYEICICYLKQIGEV
jgi:hypothetical protein